MDSIVCCVVVEMVKLRQARSGVCCNVLSTLVNNFLALCCWIFSEEDVSSSTLTHGQQTEGAEARAGVKDLYTLPSHPLFQQCFIITTRHCVSRGSLPGKRSVEDF